MPNISLRQYASLLVSNTVLGMARTLRLTPPISVRNLVAVADRNKDQLKDIKDDYEDPKDHKDQKETKDSMDLKELWDPIYGGGGGAEARTASAAFGDMDQAAEGSNASGQSGRPATLLIRRPIV